MSGRVLFLLFVAVPLTETWLLIEVGGRIGALATIAMIILTAAIGSNLVRSQGLKAHQDIQRKAQRGEPVGLPVLEGFLILVAGICLLFPGFITDGLGFVLLLPPLRKALLAGVGQRLVQSITPQGQMGGFTQQGGPTAGSPFNPPPNGDGDIIDGEFSREDENADATSGAKASQTASGLEHSRTAPPPDRPV